MDEKRWFNSVERVILHWALRERQIVPQDVNLKIHNTLEIPKNDLALKAFNAIWIMSYYDLYFANLEDIRNILKQNNLGELYKEVTWETLGRLSKSNIEKFWNKIGLIKWSYEELLSSIKNEFEILRIWSINNLISIRVIDFINILLSNNRFKYFFRLFSKTKFRDIKLNDVISFWTKLCLRELDMNELKISIIKILKDNNINSTRDLNNMKVVDFRKMVEENELIKYYFVYFLKKRVSYIRELDIEKFWINVWLLSNFDNSEEIRLFLLHNNIKNYWDLKSIDRDELKTLLWSNEFCKNILKEIWVKVLRDIRDIHFQKFARKVWLELVPKHFEYNKNEAIKIINLKLKKKWINSKNDLNKKGIKVFRTISNISNTYEAKMIQFFIKENFGCSLSSLRVTNLDYLIELLWFI